MYELHAFYTMRISTVYFTQEIDNLTVFCVKKNPHLNLNTELFFHLLERTDTISERIFKH